MCKSSLNTGNVPAAKQKYIAGDRVRIKVNVATVEKGTEGVVKAFDGEYAKYPYLVVTGPEGALTTQHYHEVELEAVETVVSPFQVGDRVELLEAGYSSFFLQPGNLGVVTGRKKRDVDERIVYSIITDVQKLNPRLIQIDFTFFENELKLVPKLVPPVAPMSPRVGDKVHFLLSAGAFDPQKLGTGRIIDTEYALAAEESRYRIAVDGSGSPVWAFPHQFTVTPK